MKTLNSDDGWKPFNFSENSDNSGASETPKSPDNSDGSETVTPGGLRQWPIKIAEISASAPYFHKAHLLLACDCAAFAYANFHRALVSDRVIVIGCAKTDERFADKLGEIIQLNDILSLTFVRMDAPCCANLSQTVMETIRKSKKDIPLQITTVFVEGEVVE